MDQAEAPEGTQGDLARVMEVLASPVRLELLHRLAQPAFVPDLARAMGITRQALKKHLDAMEGAGLVVASASRRGPLRATEYRANPSGLFAFKENVLGLAVQTDAGASVPVHTLPTRAERAPGIAAGAGLLLVHGDQPGRWFALEGRATAILGRDPKAEVALSYDPFASARHALLRHGPTGWTLTDLNSTNGTRVNLRRIVPGETVPVRPGDLLTIGRSHLLLREGA